MTNLVDKYKVIKFIEDYKENHNKEPQKYPINYGTLLDIMRWLYCMPTVEAVPISVIENIKHEAKMKATTEEVLDEDLYKSSLNEDTSCNCAMDESVVETEVIILDKLFEIIDRKVNEVKGDKE